MINLLDGYKAYITGAAAIIYGIILFANGDHGGAGTNILLGLGMIFGRHTAAKVEAKMDVTQQMMRQQLRNQ